MSKELETLTLIEVLHTVIADIERGAKEFLDQPYTNETYGKLLGTQVAAVQAIATILKKHLEAEL